MNDPILSIIAQECRGACREEPDFLERIRKAMKFVATGHWLTIDADLCFRGAVGGVLLAEETTDEERRRIEFTLEQIRSLNAMVAGVPMDLERMGENPEGLEPVPLFRLWQEAKAVSDH